LRGGAPRLLQRATTRTLDGIPSMAPELEVLDQLLGQDISLDLIAKLFPDREHCRRAVQAMLKDGDIRIVDSEGVPIPEWRYRELQHQPEFWERDTPYRLTITEQGAKRVS
jgi:hypothetical protein